MSERLDDWQIETNDLGKYSESDLVSIWWKNGEQPITNMPIIIPNTEENPGLTYVDSDLINLSDHALIELHCSTQGASITYATEEGDNAEWKIYSGPIRLKKGKNLIRAIACRYGYKDSQEIKTTIEIK